MEDTLTLFATHHHLHIRRDECRDLIIPGRNGHIFDNHDGRLGVCLMPGTKMRWTYAKRKLIAAGFVLHQDGDDEGTLTFDPPDRDQARAAIKAAGARPKRDLFPAQRAARFAGLRKAWAAKAAARIA